MITLPLMTPTVAQPQPLAPSQTAAGVLQQVDRVEASFQTFDPKAGQRKAQAIVTGTVLACGAVGRLAHALLPAAAAAGVGSTLSVGLACVGMMAANEVMHGVRDKSLLGGAGVLSFFMGFMNAMGSVSPVVGACVTGVAAVGFGFMFSRQLETNHHGIPGRITDARRLAEKFEKYHAQHAELMEEMKKQGGAAPA